MVVKCKLKSTKKKLILFLEPLKDEGKFNVIWKSSPYIKSLFSLVVITLIIVSFGSWKFSIISVNASTKSGADFQ